MILRTERGKQNQIKAYLNKHLFQTIGRINIYTINISIKKYKTYNRNSFTVDNGRI